MGWGSGNIGGGGGTSLNFDVKAYATEEALLAATPKENTIGVITTNKITSWIFSAAEPAEPVEGMVWISIGTSSETAFNALKKNGIMVYPLAAKQYVSGAWTDVTAMSYQGEEWVAWWNGELYSYGDEYEYVTGGWEKYSGTCTKYDDYIYFYGGWISTANKIDLTNFKTLEFEVKNKSNWVEPTLGIGTAKNSQSAKVTVGKNVTAYTKYSLDVSSYKGEYYINGYSSASTDGVSTRVVKLFR